MQSREEEIRAKIIARCWKDPTFKAKFLKDPRGVLQKEFNYSLSPEINLKVIEADAKTVTFIIPLAPASSGEISEAEMAQMAAGGGCLTDIYHPSHKCSD